MRDLNPAAARVQHVRRDLRGDCGCAARVAALADALAEVIAVVSDLAAEQPAPVHPIARGPLDYTPPADITLATVVPDNADPEWWRSHVVPMTPGEES